MRTGEEAKCSRGRVGRLGVQARVAKVARMMVCTAAIYQTKVDLLKYRREDSEGIQVRAFALAPSLPSR
jgi:hypothetical protein